MTVSNDIYIGIGSNLDNPLEQVRQAIDELATSTQSKLLTTSSLYQSPPMGPSDQPDYINAVARIGSDLSPLALLDALQAIETKHGRVRSGEQWGPRSLDLDLLLYGEKTINNARLIVPHPGLHERSFVLYPLQEISPDLVIPGRGSLAVLIENCERAGLERIHPYAV